MVLSTFTFWILPFTFLHFPDHWFILHSSLVIGYQTGESKIWVYQISQSNICLFRFSTLCFSLVEIICILRFSPLWIKAVHSNQHLTLIIFFLIQTYLQGLTQDFTKKLHLKETDKPLRTCRNPINILQSHVIWKSFRSYPLFC